MSDRAADVRQARDLLTHVTQAMTGGGTREAPLHEVVLVMAEVPGLLRAVATLLDQVDPAVAEVVMRGAQAPTWFHSPAERARYVASGLRSKADDVVGVVAKLRLVP